MSTGALIFAFDNENTGYLDLAAWSAERVKRFLKIPVAGGAGAAMFAG